MANIETSLEKRIQFLFDELSNEPVGSERYKDLKEELQKLYDIRNDEIKIHAEEKKAYDINEIEIEKLEFEKRRSIKDRIVSIGTTVFSVGASVLLANKIMKFEEQGVLTSKSWNQCIPKIRWLK